MNIIQQDPLFPLFHIYNIIDEEKNLVDLDFPFDDETPKNITKEDLRIHEIYLDFIQQLVEFHNELKFPIGKNDDCLNEIQKMDSDELTSINDSI